MSERPEIERHNVRELEGLQRRARDIHPPSWTEWAGFWLALSLLAAVVLLLAGTFGYGVYGSPDLAQFGTPVTEQSQALHQKAAEAHWQRVGGFRDKALDTLLPVMTLLLGYVFGSRPGQRGASE